MPQQYLTPADLSVQTTAEAGASAATADKPNNDMKMALFDKASVKKALYCSLMRRLEGKVGLLEVKFDNDVFTVTAVFLGIKDDDKTKGE